jgi:hypothetical protein
LPNLKIKYKSGKEFNKSCYRYDTKEPGRLKLLDSNGNVMDKGNLDLNKIESWEVVK